MGLFRRRDPAVERAAVRAITDARIARNVEREAALIVRAELRPLLLAEAVERIRAEMGIVAVAATVPEIATPVVAEVAPKPRRKRAPKVSTATVEPETAPELVSADVAQAAPATASPVVAAETPITPARPRKTRKVAAKVASVPAEPVTVPLPITVREPCGVDPVFKAKKGGKCASLGIVFK